MRYYLLFLGFITFPALAQSTVRGIHHVSLSVRDLNKSVGFYQAVTGLQPVGRTRISAPVLVEKQSGLAGKTREVAVLQSQNARLELIQFDGAGKQPKTTLPVQGPGITHVCYQSPTGVSIYSKAKANGATIVSRGSQPVDRGYGIQYSYIRDPDGLLFENEQIDKPKFVDSLWVAHVAIVTPDIDRLVNFYKQLLGTNPINRIDNIRNSPKLDDIANIDSLRLRAAWFNAGNMVLELWQFDNPKTTAPQRPVPFTQLGYQQIAFEVGNMDAEVNRLITNGVAFLSKPVQSGDETSVFFRDPDENLLRLIALKPGASGSVERLKKNN